MKLHCASEEACVTNGLMEPFESDILGRHRRRWGLRVYDLVAFEDKSREARFQHLARGFDKGQPLKLEQVVCQPQVGVVVVVLNTEGSSKDSVRCVQSKPLASVRGSPLVELGRYARVAAPTPERYGRGFRYAPRLIVLLAYACLSLFICAFGEVRLVAVFANGRFDVR